MKTYTCKYCGKQFEFESTKKAGGFMSAHIRMCEKNPNRNYYIQQMKDAWHKGSLTSNRKKHNQIELTRKERTFICENPKCHKEFTKNLTETEFKHYQSQKHFCCRSCSNTRIHSAETKAKVSATLKRKKSSKFTYEKCELRKTKCLDCQKEIYVKTTADVYCKECIDNHPEYHRFQVYTFDGHRVLSKKVRKAISDRIQLAVKNGKHKGWKTRSIASFPETFWKTVLENNQIEYEFNYPIKKSSLGLQHEASCYFLDFKLKDKIDLEIDGKQHKYPERKANDLKRDNLLKKNGWKVYRIEWNEISSEEGSKLMKKKIDDFLQWYHIQ